MKERPATGLPQASRRDLLRTAVLAVPTSIAIRAAPAAMRGTDSLAELGAREASVRIRRGEISAESYFGALLHRAEGNRYLNGIAALDAERMLSTARSIDIARRRGEPLGPAAGVPFAVKDQIAVEGYPAASGNPALMSYHPRHNAAVVQALVRAGAVPFAKTTCPNMTADSTATAQCEGYSPAYGVVRNPYAPVRTAGGSSGGSAVVLAARIVPAALGEDTNGSIRLPSSFCGVAGLRPSTYTIDNALNRTARKRYSDDGLIIASGRLDTIGPMARTVSDLAFLDQLICGEAIPTVALRGTRIGIPQSDYWEQDWVDPAVAAVVRHAFERLREAGVRLIEIDYLSLRATVSYLGGFAPLGMIAQTFNDRSDPTSQTAAWLKANMPHIDLATFNGPPIVHKPRDWGKMPDLDPNEQAALLRDGSRQYLALFRETGIVAIAAPTTPIRSQLLTPGAPTDFETVQIKDHTFDRASVYITQTVIAPRYGAPSLSLPAGMADGLPIGLGLDGVPGADRALLGLGIAIEQILGPLPQPHMMANSMIA